jgi:putative acetyltransferase
MLIRPIKKEDNQRLAEIIRGVFEEYDAPRVGTVFSDPTTDFLYELFEKQPKSILWVAENEGKILGCCGLLPIEGIGNEYVELVKFYLSKDARGKGIGKILLEKSIDSAKELGFESVYLESLPVFDTAVKMYYKAGFEKLSKPVGNSIHTTCDVWMSKKL